MSTTYVIYKDVKKLFDECKLDFRPTHVIINAYASASNIQHSWNWLDPSSLNREHQIPNTEDALWLVRSPDRFSKHLIAIPLSQLFAAIVITQVKQRGPVEDPYYYLGGESLPLHNHSLGLIGTLVAQNRQLCLNEVQKAMAQLKSAYPMHYFSKEAMAFTAYVTMELLRVAHSETSPHSLFTLLSVLFFWFMYPTDPREVSAKSITEELIVDEQKSTSTFLDQYQQILYTYHIVLPACHVQMTHKILHTSQIVPSELTNVIWGLMHHERTMEYASIPTIQTAAQQDIERLLRQRQSSSEKEMGPPDM